MATKRNEPKVKDITNIIDTTKETADLVKESYLTWFELTTSLWEENLKTLNNQLDKWLGLQENYINLLKNLSGRFSNGDMRIWNGGLKPLNSQTDWFISVQRDYTELISRTSDKLTKDVINLNQKSVERAFSAFDSYLTLR